MSALPSSPQISICVWTTLPFEYASWTWAQRSFHQSIKSKVLQIHSSTITPSRCRRVDRPESSCPCCIPYSRCDVPSSTRTKRDLDHTSNGGNGGLANPTSTDLIPLSNPLGSGQRAAIGWCLHFSNVTPPAATQTVVTVPAYHQTHLGNDTKTTQCSWLNDRVTVWDSGAQKTLGYLQPIFDINVMAPLLIKYQEIGRMV